MKTSFWTILFLAGVFSVEASASLSFVSAKAPQPKIIGTVSYLSETNTALGQALVLHNYMNRIPSLKEVQTSADHLKKEKNVISDQLSMMEECYAKNLGNVYKNPKQAWGKMASAYEAKRQVQKPKTAEEMLNMTSQELLNDEKNGWYLNREVMMDVYKNPSKYGEVEDKASFPLWKDQITLYDQQWDNFYENMNKQFGAPLKGRPAVEDSVRYNAKKYDQVLAAHKGYLAELKKTKNKDFKALPPKAPESLPDVNNMVFVEKGKIYPEMPEIWKNKENQKTLAKSGGEFSQIFENGNINKPSPTIGMMDMGDLEKEYSLRLALDSIEKGGNSIQDTTNKMKEKFLNKVAEAGVDTTGIDLSTSGQYEKLKKLIKEKKQEKIAEAYDYVKKLEAQDLAHPELISNRQKIRQARLSKEAQNAVNEVNNGVIPVSQMSPVAQQKLVLAALEKDSEAKVHLTETNAMDVDQMIKERESSNKIIAESQKKMAKTLEEQEKLLPKFKTCPF